MAGTAGLLLIWSGPNGQAAASQHADRVSGEWYVAQEFDDVIFTALDMASPELGWAGTNGGELYRYNGSEWRLSSDRAPSGVDAIDMQSSNKGWAVGGTGQSGYVLEYAGGRWHQIEGLDVPILLDVTAVSEDEAWAVGFWGTLLHGKSGKWAEVEIATDGALPDFLLYGIAMGGDDQGWAVGSDGIIAEYSGDTWHVHRRPNEGNDGLISVFAVSATEAWAAGSGGSILEYRNSAWTHVHSPTNRQLLDIEMLSATDGWMVGGAGEFGEILRYRDGRWVRQASPVDQGIRAVSMVSGTEGWAASYHGSILHYVVLGLAPRAFLPLAQSN